MKVLKLRRPILNSEKDEMIDIFINCHTAGYDCLDDSVFEHESINAKRIACGMTKPSKYDLSEVADFYPTYASLNSSIFESSIILTVWEHIENMSDNEYIGFLHTDIEPYFTKHELWAKIIETLSPNNVSLGVSFPEIYKTIQNGEWDLKNDYVLRPSIDPLVLHKFDLERSIWDAIKRLDRPIYEFAMSKDPPMIYSHMFITTRKIFNKLGMRMRNMLDRLLASEMGLWTPHLFERLVGLYLSELSVVKNVAAFSHHAGSSPTKRGSFSLYGTAGYKYYKTSRKIFI